MSTPARLRMDEAAVLINNFTINSTEYLVAESRHLSWAYNITNITKAADVSISALKYSFYLNCIAFITGTIIYEFFRNRYPSIYNGRYYFQNSIEKVTGITIPRGFRPLAWVPVVYKVEWDQILEFGGLDSYCFLRYIRMLLRITTATAFWALSILVPIYYNGVGCKNCENCDYVKCEGFYSISMSNLKPGADLLWVSVLFLWLFSFYVYYVMKKEFRLYVYLRMRFLGKGDPSLDPQHFYSVIVEKIPTELRSDKALYDYFSSLFPGKIHSARVVLKLPELEALSIRRKRVVHRLEKAIAAYESSGGERPIHLVGRPRLMCCGIQSEPIGCPYRCCGDDEIYEDLNPPQGVWVDSIKYYANDLNQMNRELADLQLKCANTARASNTNIRAKNWISKVMKMTTSRLPGSGDEDSSNTENKDKSIKYGALVYPTKYDSDLMTEPLLGSDDSSIKGSDKYGKAPGLESLSPLEKEDSALGMIDRHKSLLNHDRHYALVRGDSSFTDDDLSQSQTRAAVVLQKVVKEFGLDFVKDSLFSIDNQIDTYLDEVTGLAISSTGFITFNDLATKTCATNTPATYKVGNLKIDVAPEPRDVIWENVPRDLKYIKRKVFFASIMNALGAFFWSIPISLIQAFANIDSLANIPGMDFLRQLSNSQIALINGYLPVIALLILIDIIPMAFEWVAEFYENRKTLSDMQHSVLTRYFYYQVANIFVTVTAASIWDSLAGILEFKDLSGSLTILGENLPKVVGYFVSLVVTKTLGGLPATEMRMGEFCRRTFLRTIFSEKKLTQRELDEVYRPQYFYYGWEYPTQLFVIMIVFTYAVISPIILPFAAVYFFCALLLYKKLHLFVYTPRYESGGGHFPIVMDRTLVGLICGQLTFVGFVFLREGVKSLKYFAILPLPFFSMHMRDKFHEKYVKPCNNLSLERARGIDIEESEKVSSDDNILHVTSSFDEHAYRQPVLIEGKTEPLPYRIGKSDKLKDEITDVLNLNNSSSSYLKMMDSASDNYEEFGFKKVKSFHS